MMSLSNARKILVAAAVVLAAVALAGPMSGRIDAQQQTRDQRATPPPGPMGTGVLSGVVTSEDSGRPVRNAYLVLLGIMTGTVKVSASDADGRFTFANLPADRYTLGASKPPYLGTVAGARRPGRSGTPIAVADGQKVSTAIRMPMGASISGVITDERGQPSANTAVTVRQLRVVNGERTLVSPPGAPSQASTDDRGRYRVFGLLPGEYIVTSMGFSPLASARPLSITEVDGALRGASGAAPVPTPTATPPSGARPAPVHYPGTTRITDAVPVALATGEDRINIDFKLQMVQTAKIEGIVVGADGQQITTVPVSLRAVGASLLTSIISVRTLPDGRFSFSGVVPGSYMLLASGAGPSANHYATTTIEVSGADVLGMQLTMRPMLSISGRLEFRGAGTMPAIAGRRVAVRAVNPLSGIPIPNVSPTNDTGTFMMASVVPGTYIIGAPLSFGPTPDSMTWALESVTADGRDVTDRPIDVTVEALPKEIVVTYSDRYQELNGKLSRADGSPVSEYTIIVFPEDKTLWVTGSRRIVTTRPGTDGRFSLSGIGPTTLPAGKYLLAAVTDIDRNEQFDPAFLASIVPAAAPITLAPGEKKVQDLIVK